MILFSSPGPTLGYLYLAFCIFVFTCTLVENPRKDTLKPKLSSLFHLFSQFVEYFMHTKE